MKTLSTHAAAAKAIRKELKQAFPAIKFSVRAESFAGGNSITVSWENGPSSCQVKSFVNKYQAGSFNGMEDIYEYDNVDKTIPQVKYTFCSRKITDDVYQQAFADAKSKFSFLKDIDAIDKRAQQLSDNTNFCTPRELLRGFLNGKDLSNGYNKQMLERQLS